MIICTHTVSVWDNKRAQIEKAGLVFQTIVPVDSLQLHTALFISALEQTLGALVASLTIQYAE